MPQGSSQSSNEGKGLEDRRNPFLLPPSQQQPQHSSCVKGVEQQELVNSHVPLGQPPSPPQQQQQQQAEEEAQKEEQQQQEQQQGHEEKTVSSNPFVDHPSSAGRKSQEGNSIESGNQLPPAPNNNSFLASSGRRTSQAGF
jgi:hypothetical protein